MDKDTALGSNTQLIILGTGNAMATKCYNTCFALKTEGGYFLTDAGGGNGIMIQLEKAGIDYENIHHTFVTHGHTDHVLGVIWVIRKIAMQMSSGEYTGDFTIYCHDELANMITIFCNLTLPEKLKRFLGNRIVLCKLKDGDKASVNGMEVQFFDIGSTKLKQFGFRATLPGGTSVVCLGDEPYNDICQKYVEDCDWLLSEAFCLHSEREIFKPYEKHHSTVLDAARVAGELHAKNLVLYHTEDKNLATRKARYTQEAKSVFQGGVFVPDDLEII